MRNIYNVHVLNNIKDPLNEREFELINIVGAELAANQRDISRQLNLSLGMTNLLLKRMIVKGYIRITQLNKKKVQYLLTTKGFSEKMRKSVRYTLKTIDSIGLIRKNLVLLFQSPQFKEANKFYIIGGVDIADLIEGVIKEQLGHSMAVVRAAAINKSMKDGVVLICQEKISLEGYAALTIVNVIEEIAKGSAG